VPALGLRVCARVVWGARGAGIFNLLPL
jgi:hypothetical protein